jgi:hypothetical protein
MNFLGTLTDVQLNRLYRKILKRINECLGGGLQYGWDLPTLGMCDPGLARAYRAVHSEFRRREM